ncbi:hypothetical protein CROQUDRAFT_95938 [Cronartium quercuum f. sp. fusiforme G11]|uniref:Uncharacterized protein n=1 Tax=Cronartium quercuum f. sp. fusiforme G11 TaxID=708437 RepID=A0A9P6NBQ3_9BASI|nr:hypothetical protein CROQUDRAFT_95938 [Cronartium quercuum f. sp. fusiforme G11]
MRDSGILGKKSRDFHFVAHKEAGKLAFWAVRMSSKSLSLEQTLRMKRAKSAIEVYLTQGILPVDAESSPGTKKLRAAGPVQTSGVVRPLT